MLLFHAPRIPMKRSLERGGNEFVNEQRQIRPQVIRPANSEVNLAQLLRVCQMPLCLQINQRLPMAIGQGA